jgi:pyruvate dehydrogenase E2 component (dihydrolipoamide acetyltransferase)
MGIEPRSSDSRERMSRVRRTIAERMVRSASEIPHVTAHFEADATALLATRAELRSVLGEPVPVEALLARAVVPALATFPAFNAYVDGEDVVTYGRCDLGIALDTPAGLLVPVLRDVERMGAAALAVEVRRLMQRATARELLPDEMRGATCTISNLGALGGGHVTSILPPGTSAFLSFGRAKPVLRLAPDGPVEVPAMPISVTVDHRAIDGGPVMRFAARLIEQLEGMTPAAVSTPHEEG